MSVVFHAPPGWPRPPLGWLPPPGWQPPSSWPPAPSGWTFYLELVPSYRRHAILVRPWKGVVDPAYRTTRSWNLADRARSTWSWLAEHAIVTVPVGVIAAMVTCVLLLSLIARGTTGVQGEAMRVCAAAVESEAAARTQPTDAASTRGLASPGLRVSDVSEPGTNLMAVSGIYRAQTGAWRFTCQMSTATETPTLGQVDLTPIVE